MTGAEAVSHNVEQQAGNAGSPDGRRKLVTLAVLVALLAVVSTVIALSSGEEEGNSRSIKAELAPLPDGGQELLITVSDDLNVPTTTKGAPLVDILCRNESGEVVLQAKEKWPLARDGDPPLPHAHLTGTPEELRSLAACKIDGTSPALEGRVGLRQ